MHGSPSCTITVARFRAWRAGVAVVALAGLATLGAWLLASPLGERPWPQAGVALAAIATVALAASLWRQPVVRLRWDGLGWTVAAAAGAGPEVPGRREVASDLGSFLLLPLSSRRQPGAGGGPLDPGRAQRPGARMACLSLRRPFAAASAWATARRAITPTLSDDVAVRRRAAGRAGQTRRRQGLRDAGREIPAADRATDRPDGA